MAATPRNSNNTSPASPTNSQLPTWRRFASHSIFSATITTLALLSNNANNEKGWQAFPDQSGEPRTMIGWPVHPTGLYWASRFFYDEYQLPLYVIENGLSSMDWVDTADEVKDHQRIDFLTRYLGQYHPAHAGGVPLKGYFHWSLMDNFEWAQGYVSDSASSMSITKPSSALRNHPPSGIAT